MTVLSACGKKKAVESTQPAILAVHGLRVSTVPLVPMVYGAGVVRGEEEAVLIAKVAGTITHVSFEVGDFVKAGTVLAAVENTAYKRAAEQAKLHRDSAKKSFEVDRKLLTSGAVSRAQFEKSEADYRGAQAQYETRRRQYENSFIRAPVDGYIADKNAVVNVGSALGAGTVIGRISQRDAVQVQIAVADTYIPLLVAGDSAVAHIPALNNERYLAKIIRVSSVADAETGGVTVTLSLIEPESDENNAEFGSLQDKSKFRTGLVASASIPVIRGREYPIVPKTVIMEQGNQRFIYTAPLTSGAGSLVRVSRRAVKIGMEFAGNVEIVDGLSAEEAQNTAVIISGITKLSDGKTVAVTVVGDTNTF